MMKAQLHPPKLAQLLQVTHPVLAVNMSHLPCMQGLMVPENRCGRDDLPTLCVTNISEDTPMLPFYPEYSAQTFPTKTHPCSSSCFFLFHTHLRTHLQVLMKHQYHCRRHSRRHTPLCHLLVLLRSPPQKCLQKSLAESSGDSSLPIRFSPEPNPRAQLHDETEAEEIMTRWDTSPWQVVRSS